MTGVDLPIGHGPRRSKSQAQQHSYMELLITEIIGQVTIYSFYLQTSSKHLRVDTLAYEY